MIFQQITRTSSASRLKRRERTQLRHYVGLWNCAKSRI